MFSITNQNAHEFEVNRTRKNPDEICAVRVRCRHIVKHSQFNHPSLAPIPKMTTIKLHNDKKRKAASLESDHDVEYSWSDDDAEEKHSFKKIKKVGVEVTSCDEQSLTYASAT